MEAFVCRSTPGNHPARRRRPAGERRGGAHGGSGAGSGASLGLSFSVAGMGGRVDSADGPRSTEIVLFSASPTWKPPAHRKKDPSSGNGREPGTDDYVRVQTLQQPPPSGLSLHLRTMGALTFSHSPGLGLVSGRRGIPREYGGGPWLGLRLCLGWRCGRVAVVTGEVGLRCPGICVRFAHPATTRAP